ncbi:MAG: hypothetical protein RIG82_09900 [Phycisphaeraceae bacterium]
MLTQLSASLALMAALLACVAPTHAEEPFRHEGQSELFVDDARVSEMVAVERFLHQATKREKPVLEPEMPWEHDRIYIYGTVHYNEERGLFQMWYGAEGICYAESDDGINWRRPELGLYEYEGSTANNIVLPSVRNPTVFVDEQADDPQERYKALFGSRSSYQGAYSADGLNWKFYNDGKPLIPYGSELSTVNRDPESGEYLAYIRTGPPRLDKQGILAKRTCALTTSRDFRDWSLPAETIVADEWDDHWILGHEQATEFYGWNGFRYGSQYLGFLTVFKVTGLIRVHPPSQSAWDGPIDVQLIHSRDGRNWNRTTKREPVVPNGPYDYDAGTILDIANNPIVVGDELWLYYTAINTTHGGMRPPKRITIALATWPRDRLASLRARWAEGVVTTRPMISEEGRLIVNADASEGRMAVEVLDRDGNVLPGFSAQDCEVIRSDDLDHQVRWAGGDTIGGARAFALRFRMQHAHLFSYRIEP